MVWASGKQFRRRAKAIRLPPSATRALHYLVPFSRMGFGSWMYHCDLRTIPLRDPLIFLVLCQLGVHDSWNGPTIQSAASLGPAHL